jgi:hypothetical protein
MEAIMANESFIFYQSFHKALESLPAETYKNIMVAISKYALYGEEPELDGVENSIFTLIKPQLDANNRRRKTGKENGQKGAEYGKMGGRPKESNSKNPQETPKEPLDNPQETPKEPISEEKKPPNVNVNVNDNVNDNISAPSGAIDEKPESPKRFVKPSLQDVAEYCKGRKNSIDPEAFIAFYESKGWKIGSNAMKDWRMAIITWEKNSAARPYRAADSPKIRSVDLLGDPVNPGKIIGGG